MGTVDLKNQEERTAEEASDNKALRERAAKLEGELIAWKTIKPETQKTPAGRNIENQNNLKAESPKSGKGKLKQTEWPEEISDDNKGKDVK